MCFRLRGMVRCARLCVGLLLVPACFPSMARAQDAVGRTSSLSFVRMPGAEGCLSGRQLAEAVESRLGRAVFVSPSQADVAVEARIEPAGAAPSSEALTAEPHYIATVVLSGSDGAPLGERTLEGEASGCAALDAPLALVIALMIDPEAALLGHGPPPVPPPVEVRIERVVEVHTERVPGAPWRIELDGGLAVAVGVLPGEGLGLTGVWSLQPPRFVPIVLEVGLFPRTTARAPDRGQVRFLLAWGGASICPLAVVAGPVRFRACAGALLGAIRASGSGFSLSETEERVVAHLLGRVRLAVRVAGPVHLWLRGAALVPLRRDRFEYLDAAGQPTTLFQSSVVGGMFDAGLGLEIE